MSTFRDPIECFAPIEVIERLLEIRAEFGYEKHLFLNETFELADFFDAYGFDVYVFGSLKEKITYGEYHAPIAPGGFRSHDSLTAH
jgi:hypothetical protein